MEHQALGTGGPRLCRVWTSPKTRRQNPDFFLTSLGDPARLMGLLRDLRPGHMLGLGLPRDRRSHGLECVQMSRSLSCPGPGCPTPWAVSPAPCPVIPSCEAQGPSVE